MTKKHKIVAAVVVLALVTAAFFAGSHLTEQRHLQTRAGRCRALLIFEGDGSPDSAKEIALNELQAVLNSVQSVA